MRFFTDVTCCPVLVGPPPARAARLPTVPQSHPVRSRPLWACSLEELGAVIPATDSSCDPPERPPLGGGAGCLSWGERGDEEGGVEPFSISFRNVFFFFF